MMQPFLDILLSGILIGVLVSAPMGPVGMLCIQRTLNKGRWSGLFTGVGAAFSDLLYCLLTGLGLSFVQGFIEENSLVLQIVGSFALIGFGIYLFKKNPSASLKRPEKSKNTFGADVVTGFLFTFSNPFILFFIISLFGRFNFLLPEYQHYHYIAGYSGILLGALTWWYVITFFVNKVRAHFNVRSMWLINRIIGSLILLMAAYGIYSGLHDYYLDKNEQNQPTLQEVPDSTAVHITESD
ncbi:MAG: LysE family translocator [Muribaculaceae bacterium]|nr:LysE family translocator [Muribaculaceae bacterium]